MSVGEPGVHRRQPGLRPVADEDEGEGELEELGVQ